MKPLHAVVLLLAAAALVGLLAWGGGEPAAPGLDVADGGPAGEDTDLRSADAASGDDAPDDGGPVLDTARPAGAARGPLVVRVLGIAGQPLPEVYVTLRPSARGAAMIGKAQPTDVRGELRFDDVPYDGSHQVAFFRSNPYSRNSTVWRELPAAAGAATVRAVTGPELVYRARTGVPWRVHVVHAETGQPVEDAFVRRTREDRWQHPGHAWLVTTPVGSEHGFRCEIRAPRHVLAWESPRLRAAISPFARSLHQVHPLRREVHVSLVPQAEGGGPVAARVHRIQVAGRSSKQLSWTRDAYGRLRIEGVPFLRGELVEVEVSRENGRGRDVFWGRIPEDAAGRLELPITLSDEEHVEEPNDGRMGLGGGSSSRFRHRTPLPDNRLEVVVLRRTGRPAVGVRVRTRWRAGVTDARGEALLTGVHAGEATVRVKEPGLLPLEQTIVMPPTGTKRIVLREGEGCELQVEVVDEAGMPLPFAELSVKTPSGVPWVDLDGDVQRLDMYTDHLGRRRLRHVEPGAVEIRAAWGSRARWVKLEALEAGGSQTVRLALARPRDP